MSSPSPACQVKDGAGAYVSTSGGVNVTTGHTITINLVSSAGVSTWAIACITTDQSDASTVNASLVIDSVAKTATFTAPAAGRAYRFQSTINGGIGPDGTVQSSYTTTFCIYTLTALSLRVAAVDETTEGGTTGWGAAINSIIRNPSASAAPTGTGFYHVTAGVMDIASKKVDLTASADVTAPTGTGYVKTTAGVVNAASATTIPAADVTASGTNENILKTSGGVTTWSTINLASSNAVGSSILPVANGGTGIAAIGSGIATWWATPSSANLRAAITDETGTGVAVFGTGPTLSNPTISDDINIGTGPFASAGMVRLPHSAGTILACRNSGNTADIVFLAADTSDGLDIGTDTADANSTVSIRMKATSSITMIAGSTAFTATTSKLEAAQPLGGSSSLSSAMKFALASITQSSTSDTTLTAAQYSCPLLDVSGTPGGAFNIIAPNTSGALFFVRNNTPSSMTFKKSGGSGVSIASTASKVVFHNGTDYVLGSG